MRSAVNVVGRAPVMPPHAARPLIALVFEGLSEQQKQLPSMLLYDAEGARLSEQVCEQPEYYVARAERRLIETHLEEISELCGRHAAIVEYGAGSARETLQLLAGLDEPRCYVPLDLDAAQLETACRATRLRLPTLQVHALCQDFRQFVSLPMAAAGARRRVAFLPGSVIGTLRPLEAMALLNSIREAMAPDGALLLGVDLLKDRATLERAYNDAAGATARFNRNVLERLNRELDATFDLAAFRHRATWHDGHKRIEMTLESLRAQVPCVAGISVPLAAGEEILTAYHHKYTAEGIASLVRVAGWTQRRDWTDVEKLYSLQFLEAAE